MERPSRIKKSINYSDFLEDDDEDFATVKAPPNKKARSSVPEYQPDQTRRNENDSTPKARKERVSLEEKIYKRDLEAALLLSHRQTAEKSEQPLGSSLGEKSELCDDAPPVLTHFNADTAACVDDKKHSSLPSEDSPPVLSNCSINVACLGLDQITSEQTPSSTTCTKRKPCTFPELKENEEDEEYRPLNTPESESDFSDQDESEDEEYTLKRKGGKKKTAKSEKKASTKAVKKEKKPAKSKPQSKAKTSAVSSPAAAKPLSALNRTPPTPPVTKSALHTSPAGGRMPKWTPPGVVGRSPNSSPPVKSPGHGLRLGLSRLARVKPLHPNAVAH